MFGLEILDVVIGLTFVFLLLSLLATAINEYISAVMNLRGKELARGLGRLLDDLDEKEALDRAFDGVGPKVTAVTDSLTERFYNHRLIRPLATRRGGFFQPFSKEPRLPSYIPARTFALALLDVLGVDQKDANIRKATDDAREIAEKVAQRAEASVAEAKTEAQRIATEADAAAKATATTAETSQSPQDVATAARARRRAQTAAEISEAVRAAANKDDVTRIVDAVTGRVQLVQVLEVLKRESPFDVKEHLSNLEALLAQSGLPSDVRTQFVSALTGSQTQLQQLHDSVEVWFNNSMDRVSGAYKRTVQGWLFVIGLLIASCSNADTIDMWRRLSENDKLREGMAARAIASVGVLDSVVHSRAVTDTTTPSPQPGSGSGQTGGSGQTNNDSTPQRSGAAQQSGGSPQTPCDSARVTRDPPQPGAGSGQTGAGSGQTGTPPDAVAAIPKPLNRADSAQARVDTARMRYQAARARLDSMELKLGWTRENLVSIGFLDTLKAKRKTQALVDAQSKKDSAAVAKASNGKWWYGLNTASTRPGPFFSKLLGLFLTAIAISLGAPFWFDLLNKVISIRASGRAPHEKPKSPEGSPKRAAEHTPM